MDGADDGKVALETALETINTINDVLNEFDDVVDEILLENNLFATANEKLSKSTDDKYYSRESMYLVGHIQTQLINIIGAYKIVLLSIFEWGFTWKLKLDLYIELFGDGNASTQTAQKHLLIELLGNYKRNAENACTKFDICVENLKILSEHLTSLGIQLGQDFDENGEYFRRKLVKSDDSNIVTKLLQWCYCCGSDTTTTYDVEMTYELKEKLNSIQQFWENLKLQVDQTIFDVKEAKEKLNDKIPMIGEQINRVGETKTYAVLDSNVELHNSVIESVNNLIVTRCTAAMMSH